MRDVLTEAGTKRRAALDQRRDERDGQHGVANGSGCHHEGEQTQAERHAVAVAVDVAPSRSFGEVRRERGHE